VAIECADPTLHQCRPGTNIHRDILFRYAWCDARVEGYVLDVPCGMGWGTSLITHASKVIGVDRNEKYLTIARQRYPHLTFIQGDMTSLPFGDGEFNGVICCEGIEHVPAKDTKRVVRELWRVLSDTGTLVGSIPLGKGKHPNEYHLTTWTTESALALFSSVGLEVKEHLIKYNMLLFRVEGEKDA